MEPLANLVYRRPWTILALSFVAVVVAALAGSGVLGKLQGGGFSDPASESVRATDTLIHRFGVAEPNLVLLVTARGAAGVDDPAVSAEAVALVHRLAAEPGVHVLSSYWGADPVQRRALRSHDGRRALVIAAVSGDYDTARKRTDALAHRYTPGGPHLTVGFGGFEQIQSDLVGQSFVDLRTTESVAVPIITGLLVLAFGSVVAGALPLLVGGIAIVGALASLWLFALFTDVSLYGLNLTTALGLGLGIDYSLLMVSRYREEMGAGHDSATALRRTMGTAGRTIVYSAVTVAAGLAALAVFPLYFLRSFAYAGVAVVLIAAVGALVTLPAVLLLLGPRRLEKWSVRRRTTVAEGRGFWHGLASLVMRHPVLLAVPVVAVLAVAASGFLNVTYWYPNDQVLPTSAQSRQVGDEIRRSFAPDANSTLTVVLPAAVGDGALRQYADRLSGLPTVTGVRSAAGTFALGRQVGPRDPARGGPGGTYLTLASSTDPYSAAGEQLVRTVRGTPAPAAPLVTGDAALLVDVKSSIADRLPAAISIIVLTTFVLLFLFTGSVVIPVKALLLNLLTLSSVMGILVWIFQYGHGATLLGVTPTPIAVAMPILMFCVVFGLSMDYEIFLLSRIKEQHDLGYDTATSVAVGLERSAKIVTMAAALLSVTFFALAFAQISFIKWFGVGAGLAIVIDATLVRGVLVPALMRVMGEANWWAPGPLRRLHHRIGLTEGEPRVPAGAPTGAPPHGIQPEVEQV